jgi:hypothetical protein
MTIGAAAIEGEAAPQITSDAVAQILTLAFPHPIAAGRHQLRSPSAAPALRAAKPLRGQVQR